MEKGNLIYINGNHDCAIRINNLLENVFKTHTELFDDIVVHFEHGDSADVFNSKYQWIGKLLTWLSSWIERWFYKDFDATLRKYYSKTSG